MSVKPVQDFHGILGHILPRDGVPGALYYAGFYRVALTHAAYYTESPRLRRINPAHREDFVEKSGQKRKAEAETSSTPEEEGIKEEKEEEKLYSCLSVFSIPYSRIDANPPRTRVLQKLASGSEPLEEKRPPPGTGGVPCRGQLRCLVVSTSDLDLGRDRPVDRTAVCDFQETRSLLVVERTQDTNLLFDLVHSA